MTQLNKKTRGCIWHNVTLSWGLRYAWTFDNFHKTLAKYVLSHLTIEELAFNQLFHGWTRVMCQQG